MCGYYREKLHVDQFWELKSWDTPWMIQTTQAFGTRLLSNASYASSNCSDMSTSPLTASRNDESDV